MKKLNSYELFLKEDKYLEQLFEWRKEISKDIRDCGTICVGSSLSIDGKSSLSQFVYALGVLNSKIKAMKELIEVTPDHLQADLKEELDVLSNDYHKVRNLFVLVRKGEEITELYFEQRAIKEVALSMIKPEDEYEARVKDRGDMIEL